MKTESFPKMHVSLYVKDIEKTANFYTKFFGKDVEKKRPGYVKFHLENPALVISFVENQDEVSPMFGHLGFQVQTTEELNSRLEAVKTLGLPTLEEKGTNCCYAKQDKFWVSDPDGYRWEDYQFHEDVEWNDPQYQTESEACCSPKMMVEPAVEKEPCCDPSGGCC